MNESLSKENNQFEKNASSMIKKKKKQKKIKNK